MVKRRIILDDSRFSPNYHQLYTRGQTGKIVIDYKEEFEQAQNG